MAARGECVIINADPRGRREWGTIIGTPKPGTVMEIATHFYRGGRHSWQPYQPGGDGNRRVIAVLLEDRQQGKRITDAYVSGTMGELYFPLPGDELNMLLADVTGTGDDHTAGEMLMVQHSTGKLIASSSPESEPFRLMETITDPTSDTLAPCMFTGY